MGALTLVNGFDLEESAIGAATVVVIVGAATTGADVYDILHNGANGALNAVSIYY
jgi:hypothetical protein